MMTRMKISTKPKTNKTDFNTTYFVCCCSFRIQCKDVSVAPSSFLWSSMAPIDCTLLSLAFSETGIISRRQFDVVMHCDVNDGSLGWSGMFVR